MRLFAPRVLAPLLWIASCVAEPIAIPEADPQQYTNNAPFSGAVYIVNPNGEQVTAQDNNWCPSSASVNCGSNGQPGWCCPSNYVCSAPGNNGLIGCCPSGNSCGGAVNVAQVSTVTVYPQQQTVTAQPPAATVYHEPDAVAAGFCATITMDGPGLPRAEQGGCGTILVVNEGTPTLKTFGIGLGVVALLLQLAFARMFH